MYCAPIRHEAGSAVRRATAPSSAQHGVTRRDWTHTARYTAGGVRRSRTAQSTGGLGGLVDWRHGHRTVI